MSRLQSGAVVGITGSIIPEPDDAHVAVGVGSDPGEDVGVANGWTLVYLHGWCPSGALIGGGREVDFGVVGPDRIHKPKPIHGQRREEILGALIVRTRRAGEDLDVGEREDWRAWGHFHWGRRADVDAAQCPAEQV